MKSILEEIDQQIAEERDKGRFRMIGSRNMTVDSLFGQIEIKRNYYRDREANKYIHLLDQYLAFDGEKGLTPLLEKTAMEMAVTGTSYQHAADTLETLLGHQVVSHEGIR